MENLLPAKKLRVMAAEVEEARLLPHPGAKAAKAKMDVSFSTGQRRKVTSENSERSVCFFLSNDKKYISLKHLTIIKEYIDKKDMDIIDVFGSITSETGVMGLRVKNGKLQYKKDDGAWADIAEAGGSGEEEPSDADFANQNDIDNLFS